MTAIDNENKIIDKNYLIWLGFKPTGSGFTQKGFKDISIIVDTFKHNDEFWYDLEGDQEQLLKNCGDINAIVIPVKNKAIQASNELRKQTGDPRYQLIIHYVHSLLEQNRERFLFFEKHEVDMIHDFLTYQPNQKILAEITKLAKTTFEYDISFSQQCNAVELFLKSNKPTANKYTEVSAELSIMYCEGDLVISHKEDADKFENLIKKLKQ